MRRIVHFLFAALILLMCATPLALLALGVNSPNLEKRVLSGIPSLMSPTGSLNSHYMTDLDNFIADHFPLRTALISGWHGFNISILGQSGNSRVVLGRDHWLFFAETVRSYMGYDLLSPTEYARLDRILRLQAEYLASRGVAFLFTVAPNKSTVYPGLMPSRYTNRTAANALAELPANVGIDDYVNLRDLLRSAAMMNEDASASPLYMKTDSHWNNQGALLACSRLLEAAGAKIDHQLVTPYQSADMQERPDWQGDLAVMLFPSGPPQDVQQYYNVSQTYRYAKPIKSLEDLLIQTRKGSAGPDDSSATTSLLMFRDSFANALIPMLSEAFDTATYSRGVPYDYGLLDAADADLVLIEIAERNLRDWLQTPPRMPALPCLADEQWVSADPQPLELTAEAKADGQWLKISGRITAQPAGQILPADWTSILITCAGQTYEAFPVTSESDGSARFVLYLADGWSSGTQEITARILTGSGWQQAVAAIDLPQISAK